MKILIIEDEHALSEAIKASLELEQYVVETTANYGTAHEKVFMYAYDCILLDIMLPGGSGLQILRELNTAGKTENVIIISAKDALDDKVEALNLGADDYLSKPFHLSELNARVKAVLRRNKLNGKETLDIANVSLDVVNRMVMVQEVELPLNRKEFDILKYFMMNKNRLITRNALAEYVWGDHIDQADNFDFIYYQIKNLRKKLQSTPAQIEIQAIYGIGYKLVEL